MDVASMKKYNNDIYVAIDPKVISSNDDDTNVDDDDCCTIITVPTEETEEDYDVKKLKQNERKPNRKLVRFGSVRIHMHSLTATATLPVIEQQQTRKQESKVRYHNSYNYNNDDDDDDDDDIVDYDNDVCTLNEHQKRLAAIFQRNNSIGPFVMLEWKPFQTLRVKTVQEFDSIRIGHRRPMNMLRISKARKEQILDNTINNAIQQHITTQPTAAAAAAVTLDKIRREQQFEEKLALRDAANTILKKCKTSTQQENAIRFLQVEGFVRTVSAIQSQTNRHHYDIIVNNSNNNNNNNSNNECRKSFCGNSSTNNKHNFDETVPVVKIAEPPTKLLTMNDLQAWDRSEFGVSSNITFALATAKKNATTTRSSSKTTTIPLIYSIIENENYQQQQQQQQQQQCTNRRQSLSSYNGTNKNNATTTTKLNNEVMVVDPATQTVLSKKKMMMNSFDHDIGKMYSSSSKFLSKLKKKSKKIINKHVLLNTVTVQVAPLST